MIDLFELGQQYFKQLKSELAAYDLIVDPSLEIHRKTGLLCYYDLKDGQIYLSVPSTATAMDELRAVMMTSMLGCKDVDELIHFFSKFMPWLIAHELGHYFRHKHGLFSTNLWHEEQIANQLAVAVNKSRINPAERVEAQEFLKRAMKKLGAQFGQGDEDAVDSYHNIAHALQANGQLSHEEAANLAVVQQAFSAPSSTMMLKKSGHLNAALEGRLENRQALIESMNSEYVSNVVRYMYYQIGWINLALESQSTNYVSEFRRQHIRADEPFLNMEPEGRISSKNIQATYKAHKMARAKSDSAGRHFYKRYRSLLIQYLQQHVNQDLLDGTRLTKENLDILENWNFFSSDPLNYLISLLPGPIHGLFPSRIEQSPLIGIQVPRDLPTAGDQALWSAWMNGAVDLTTDHTLQLLNQLDTIDIFRNLSVSASIELAEHLFPVIYKEGETLVWQGEFNDDVFIPMDGQLEILRENNGIHSEIATLKAGQVVGEISWLTKGPRSTTVRAKTPVTCLVIKGSQLQVMAYRNPTIFAQIASVVANRLVGMYSGHTANDS